MDANELRRAMSRWATGVAVVTSRGADGPRGATTNAFTSLSLEPLLVLVALDEASNTLAAVRASGALAVNVLAAGQEELARRFATKASGTEKFAGIAHDEGDVPVLDGVALWLRCALERELDGGDHALLVARPLEAGGDQDAEPLVFLGGSYRAAG